MSNSDDSNISWPTYYGPTENPSNYMPGGMESDTSSHFDEWSSSPSTDFQLDITPRRRIAHINQQSVPDTEEADTASNQSTIPMNSSISDSTSIISDSDVSLLSLIDVDSATSARTPSSSSDTSSSSEEDVVLLDSPPTASSSNGNRDGVRRESGIVTRSVARRYSGRCFARRSSPMAYYIRAQQGAREMRAILNTLLDEVPSWATPGRLRSTPTRTGRGRDNRY